VSPEIGVGELESGAFIPARAINKVLLRSLNCRDAGKSCVSDRVSVVLFAIDMLD
jgi:hypothetical protein